MSHATMDDMTTMNHAGHVMPTTMAMDHAGHGMVSTVANIVTTMAMDHGSMDHGSMDHGSMDHGSMDMDMGNHSMDMGMAMYFHDGYKEYVLFEPCYTRSVGAMVGACFIIFFVAILYEGLKFLREVLLQRSLSGRHMGAYDISEHKSASSREQINAEIRTPSVMSRILSCDHLMQTLLHMVQVFISYCLMLVFMTYNVWLCVAIIVGAGVGYFCFGWKRAVVVDSNEHCH
ncbi:unnamed protein product [Candidula unifasciata]|uniref:Copper transport protein n=1 Tax=Candidula unifasciata TaxID=100452 RepID=A0A8S3Z2I9_9EUPU|nr:unnamed protein product [Candidula unifasciata]